VEITSHLILTKRSFEQGHIFAILRYFQTP
jgi:hypothetical protein